MSATKLDVTLSASLQSVLDQPGVFAYAVSFETLIGDTTATALWTTLVNDGKIANGGTSEIALTGTGTANGDLPNALDGGKIYLLIQSSDAGTSSLSSVITQQSDISPQTAAAQDFAYDSFEVSLTGTSTDDGNLTSVNGYGLPMGVGIAYNDGSSASVGYGVAGTMISDAIGSIGSGAISTFSTGPLAGEFRAALSPAEDNNGTVFPGSNWAGYVESLEGSIASEITISGMFNGAADAEGTFHNAGYYAYTLEWDGKNFWLVPDKNSQVQGVIELPPGTIEDNIYSQTGTVGIHDSVGGSLIASYGVGDNTQWGAVLAQFLTGFTGGYYERTATSANIHAGTIDLNSNNNWDPTYAFGGQNGAAVSWTGSGTVTGTPSFQTSDPYSKIFFEESNSYGSPYSDALMSQYLVGGPLISVSEPGSAANVPVIDLTLYAPDESPIVTTVTSQETVTTDTSQGYTPPVIHNVIAEPKGGYAAVYGDHATATGLNLHLNFEANVGGYAGVVLSSTATVTLKILTQVTVDGSTKNEWLPVKLDGATAGSLGLWQSWTISYSPDGTDGPAYTATPSGNTSGQVGDIIVSGVPTAQSAVMWYRIEVGSKIFNLYATTDASGNVLNPDYSGQEAKQAVDGLATLALSNPSDSTDNSIVVNFTHGDTVAYDPSLIVNNTANYAVTLPDAPVAGTLAAGDFSALQGQTGPTSNTISTPDQTIAFAWTGENNAVGTAALNGWIDAYTNKIDPGDTALITIDSIGVGGTLTQVGTLAATGQVDGQWQTGAFHFDPGHYEITMQEIVAGGTLPFSNVSGVLDLTVTSSDAAVCFLAGTRIMTPTGPVAVERLRIGESVVTQGGIARPIKWIGTRAYDARFAAGNHLVMPVRIRQGAIGAQIPARDLLVSPGHGIWIDGVLIPAWRLVNGVSVTQAEPIALIRYFHVELETHELLLAEGCPAESFHGAEFRGLFHNAADYAARHGDMDTPGAGLPRLEHGFPVRDIQRRLNRRAGLPDPAQPSGPLRGYVDCLGPARIAGWAQDSNAPEEPVELLIFSGATIVARLLANQYRADLRRAGLGSGTHGFVWDVPPRLDGDLSVRGAADGTVLAPTDAAQRAA